MLIDLSKHLKTQKKSNLLVNNTSLVLVVGAVWRWRKLLTWWVNSSSRFHIWLQRDLWFYRRSRVFCSICQLLDSCHQPGHRMTLHHCLNRTILSLQEEWQLIQTYSVPTCKFRNLVTVIHGIQSLNLKTIPFQDSLLGYVLELQCVQSWWFHVHTRPPSKASWLHWGSTHQ